MDHVVAQGAQFHAVVVVPFPGDQASPGPVAALLEPQWPGKKRCKIYENPPFLVGVPYLSSFFRGFLCGFYLSLVWVFHEACSLLLRTSHRIIPAWQCARLVLSRLLPQAQKQVTLHDRDLRVVADLRSEGLHHAHHRVACWPHFVGLRRACLSENEVTPILLGLSWVYTSHMAICLETENVWRNLVESSTLFLWGRRNIRWRSEPAAAVLESIATWPISIMIQSVRLIVKSWNPIRGSVWKHPCSRRKCRTVEYYNYCVWIQSTPPVLVLISSQYIPK